MDILLAINTLGSGGATKQFITLSNLLSRHGYRLLIVCYDCSKPYKQLASEVVIENLCLTFSSHNSYFYRVLNRIRVIFRIKYLIKHYNPKLLISFLSDVSFDVFVANLKLNKPIIASERNNPFSMKFIRRLLTLITYMNVDHVIFQTFSSSLFGHKIIKDDRRSIISNFLPLLNYSSYSQIKKKKQIISVGRLTKNKRMDHSIMAFKIFFKHNPDYYLDIYGDGEEFEFLRSLIKEMNLEGKVKLNGFEIDIERKIAESKVLLLLSENEGLPNVVLEAMANFTPVIVSDYSQGSAKQLINDNYNGHIVSLGDVNKVASILNKLVSDSNHYETIVNNAANTIQALSKDNVELKWLNVIEKHV